MIGKILDIVAKIQSDYHSAADNKQEYDRYQRFFKSPPYEKTSVSDFMTYSVLNGRLGGCLRKLRFIGGNAYAKVKGKVGCLRKEKRND